MKKFVWILPLCALCFCRLADAGTAVYTGASDFATFPATWGTSGTTTYGPDSITFQGATDVDGGVAYLPTAVGLIQDVPPSFGLSGRNPSDYVGVIVGIRKIWTRF